MRKDYQPGVLAPSQKSESEIAARDEFNRKHPPIEGLIVPHDLRQMELQERPWRNNRGQWFECFRTRPKQSSGSRSGPARSHTRTHE